MKSRWRWRRLWGLCARVWWPAVSLKPIEKPFDYSSGNEGRGRTTMGTLKPYPIDSALPPSLLSGPLFYCTNTDSTVCYSTRHWGKENTPHLVVWTANWIGDRARHIERDAIFIFSVFFLLFKRPAAIKHVPLRRYPRWKYITKL